MKNGRLIGCIADDFTGAGDVASFFKKGNMRTVLFNGIPHESCDGDYDAAVIALKTRTQETAAAVKSSMEAMDWLLEQGFQHIYIKYCSTFDSTPQGNIGPVVDAAMEKLKVPCTILCPALPVNGRTVENGKLYVNGIPLHQSHMRHHPLTPMWDSDISQLMRPQGKYPCVGISRAELYSDKSCLKNKLREFSRRHDRFYIVPDFVCDKDAERIVSLFGSLKLLTGGSGLAECLGKFYCGSKIRSAKYDSAVGKAMILAGSCSKATLGQINHFISEGGYAIKIFPEKLLSGEQNVKSILAEAAQLEEVLIYSSDTPENVKRNQAKGKEGVSLLLESATAEIARQATCMGFTRFIVAGGETSGAVTQSLGYNAFSVGECVSPGVPILIPMENEKIRLVLKSGNFGEEAFFRAALEATGIQDSK